ncbi:arylsulfotransferase family protein [Streptomyces sp. 4N509B]|uniref:arylsulfotransferase family protein n=1 Tax=Streptomyces sp. 4N509B TaxID=3457413 RepID=UPI003FCF0FEE
MRLLRTSLARSGVAMAAGVALVVPLTSAASAADAAPRLGVTALPALENSEFVTLDEPLQAPTLTTTTTGREDPGLLLTTPGGFAGASAAIYDNRGQLVWSRSGNFLNLEQITYQGQPALVAFDSSRQAHVVYDQSYREIDTLAMVNQPTDGHDIEFSPDGSRVLLQGWAPTQVDLSPWGGPSNGTVLDAVIQEQIVSTGQVTFEWSALDHVEPGETTEPMTGFGDLFHSNSLSYDADGNILTSFRNTSTVYKIDISSGEIIWRFGGENSDFTFANSADRPSYQHDARRLPDGSISIFNNGNTSSPQESRGAVYRVDESAMTATLTQNLRANPAAFSPFIGNNRQVPNGNQLVNYGTTGRMVEFAGGEQVFTGQFSSGSTSYRADRTTNWVGTPAAAPEVVVGELGEDGTRTLNVSWNGATEVDSWRVLAGTSEETLTTVGTTPKTGFETAAAVTAPADADVFRVVALDAAGQALDSRTLSVS